MSRNAGVNNPMYGKTHTEATKELIRKRAVGRKVSTLARLHMSEAHKGRTAWNKGITLPEPIRAKVALAVSQNKWRITGHRHYNWKGGITPIRTKLWTSRQYRQWRETVFQKDNYRCVACGASNGGGKYVRLEADHYPVPFAAYLSKLQAQCGSTDLYSRAIECAELWKAKGRTLCKQCHDKTKKGRATLKAERYDA